MKKVKVFLGFLRMALVVKLEFYRNVIACLTANELFSKPDVELIVLNSAVAKFAADFNASQTGSHEAVAKMRQSEKIADGYFRKIAMYVDRIADGDEAVILNAGFYPTKQPASPSRPLFSAVNSKKPGEIVLKCKAVPGAYAYTWQFFLGSASPAKDEDWVFAGTSTQVTFVVSGLTGLTKYCFRVCAVKSSGMQPWMDPIMKLVL